MSTPQWIVRCKTGLMTDYLVTNPAAGQPAVTGTRGLAYVFTVRREAWLGRKAVRELCGITDEVDDGIVVSVVRVKGGGQ